MKEISPLFEGVYAPRRSNATRYDLHEMFIIGLLSTLSGGETCSDMALYGRRGIRVRQAAKPAKVKSFRIFIFLTSCFTFFTQFLESFTN